MGKVIYRGFYPKDHPIYKGGFTMITGKNLNLPSKESKEPQVKEEAKKNEK